MEQEITRYVGSQDPATLIYRHLLKAARDITAETKDPLFSKKLKITIKVEEE